MVEIKTYRQFLKEDGPKIKQLHMMPLSKWTKLSNGLWVTPFKRFGMAELDEQGHNQSNLTFTKEEQEKYGLSNMDDYFSSIDLELYIDLEAKKRIQELTEINMQLVTQKMTKDK